MYGKENISLSPIDLQAMNFNSRTNSPGVNDFGCFKIDLFSYYLNGIVINSDKNSILAKMLYAAVDKTNFETKTYTPPNNTENEYIWLVPK